MGWFTSYVIPVLSGNFRSIYKGSTTILSNSLMWKLKLGEARRKWGIHLSSCIKTDLPSLLICLHSTASHSAQMLSEIYRFQRVNTNVCLFSTRLSFPFDSDNKKIQSHQKKTAGNLEIHMRFRTLKNTRNRKSPAT